MMKPRKMMLAGLAFATFMMPLAAQADQGRGYPRQFLGDRLREQSVAAPAPAPNQVSVVQQGSGNGAGVLQTGSANTAGVMQFGRGNTGVITQEGSGNTACLIQTGRNLNGSVQKIGDNQSDGVLQNRWGSAVIPVQLCSADTTRRDLRTYATPNPRADVRTKVRPLAQRQ
jgi:hypothetical protein